MILSEIRQTRNSIRYGFACGKLTVLASRALDAQAVERLLDARNFDERKRLLAETPYAVFLESATSTDDIEVGLGNAQERGYAFLGEAQLDVIIERFFRMRYDYENVKAILKARKMGIEPSDLLVEHGMYPVEMLLEHPEHLPAHISSLLGPVQTGSASSQSGGYGSGHSAGSAKSSGLYGRLYGKNGYIANLFKHYTGGNTPFDASRYSDIDDLIDAAFFADRLSTAQMAKSPYLVELAQLDIDLANIKIVLRSSYKHVLPELIEPKLIEGGQVDLKILATMYEDTYSLEQATTALATKLCTISSFKRLAVEDLIDSHTLDLALSAHYNATMKAGSKMAAGPEPIIAYVGRTEAEIALLRVMLLGIESGISPNDLRKYVKAFKK